MTVEFILANEDAAKIIAELRHEIWGTTYRGIYSDERIDNYDYGEHRQHDLQRIQDISYHVYLITNADAPIGYRLFHFFDHRDCLYPIALYPSGISASRDWETSICVD